MKHAETEGAWGAAIRKIVWGVPIALVVIGSLILLFAYLQPTYTATVVEVGDRSYTPSRKMVRGHTSNHYRAMLEVEYIDAQGEGKSAAVLFRTIHPHDIPKAGDRVLISRGLSGMVTHPNRNLIGIGGGAAVIGGFFILMYLLTMLPWKRKP